MFLYQNLTNFVVHLIIFHTLGYLGINISKTMYFAASDLIIYDVVSLHVTYMSTRLESLRPGLPCTVVFFSVQRMVRLRNPVFSGRGRARVRLYT